MVGRTPRGSEAIERQQIFIPRHHLGAAQRIWLVENRAAPEPIGRAGKEPVAFDEKELQRAGSRLRQFRAGLADYRHGRWKEAIRAFEEVLEMNPADKTAKLYVERCQHLQEKPPAGEWNGVWVMEEK